MSGREYSPELCQYIGRFELAAFEKDELWKRRNCFCFAFDSLSVSGLTSEDSKLAADILYQRIRDTRSSNIGCASGEAGEAD